MIRALITLAILAGLGGAAYWFFAVRTGGEPNKVPTFVVAEDTLARRITAEGNLKAVKATPITVPRSGGNMGMMKVAWLAPDGQHVKQGDVVVRFDRSQPEKKLRDGQADLDAASARLAAEQVKGKVAVSARDTAATLAQQELEQTQQFQTKDREIYSRNQIIESEIDEKLATARKDHAEKTKQVERNLSRSKAGLIAVEQQKAKLAIQHAQKALESMEIRAPHDGLFVVARNWRGESRKVGDTLWPGQVVGELPLLEQMEAEVFVLEVDGSDLAEKLPAQIVIEARPELVFEGKIKLVDKLAKPRIDDVPVQYFAVTVELARTDPALMKPGQRVRATLQLDEARALVVPRQAIQNKDGKNFVYRRTARGDFESVAVELGAATSGRVAVTTGLVAGDQIALRDPTRSLDAALGSGSAESTGPAESPSGAGQ